MKSKCIPKEGKKGSWIITIDDEPWREIHSSIFGKRPDIELSGDSFHEIEQKFLELELKRARRYVIYRLSQKNLCSFELRQILSSKLISESLINQLLAEFTTLGYLNDEDWIQAFIRAQQAKNKGPRVIVQKLKAKGVPDHLIEEYTQDDREHQKEIIHSLLNGRYHSRDLSDYKQRQKVIASLLRRGFDWNVIQEVLII